MRAAVVKARLRHRTHVVRFLFIGFTLWHIYVQSPMGRFGRFHAEQPAQKRHTNAACGNFFQPTQDSLNSSETIIVDNEFYGRLGNRILTYKSILRHALRSGCHVKLRRDVLEGWDPGWDTLLNTLRTEKVYTNYTCEYLPHRDWFWYEIRNGIDENGMIRYGTHELTRADVECATNSVISRYFSTNETHVLGSACPNEVRFAAVHVRGGDTMSWEWRNKRFVSLNAEPGYGPHPTSYYVTAISHMLQQGSDKVIICCEDLANPTCAILQFLSDMDDRITVRVSQDLLDDLYFLSCANDVAISTGTFYHAFLIRAGTRTVRSYRTEASNSKRDDRCSVRDPRVRVVDYFIKDDFKRQEYYEAVQAANWNNTLYQRFLVNERHEIKTTDCHR